MSNVSGQLSTGPTGVFGATDAALDGAERELRMWSRGGIHIDVPEDRLQMLGISCEVGSRREVTRSPATAPSKH
jgi:hypothetical protein